MDDESLITNNNIWPYSFIISNKFTSFINNIPDAVIISNQSGQIISCNSFALALFNYTKEELLVLTIEDLVPISAHKHQELRAHYFENPIPRILGNRTTNLNLLAKNNKIIPIDASLFSIKIDKGILAINIIRDMTDQKAKEEALVKKALYD